MDFTAQLLAWYGIHRRDLPWKRTRDPYKIWLSEIILQQTRVEQGMPYYNRFVEKYPTVQALAAAPIDEVLRLWQGLGYYSRARNLHHAARQIVAERGGFFPTACKDLLTLKGVGAYTAAAVASFACGEAVPAVDGNGYRVLARAFGIDTPIDTTPGKKQFTGLAAALLPPGHPGEFNQALMDFGSLVCTPARPLCSDCPLQDGCRAHARKAEADYPVKSKRTAVRHRYFHYLFIRQEGATYLHKRTGKDIWQGLYEFPLIETAGETSPEQLFAHDVWKTWCGGVPVTVSGISPEIKHQLTHRLLHAVFYTLDVTTPLQLPSPEFFKTPLDRLDDYSLPRLLLRFLDKFAGY